MTDNSEHNPDINKFEPRSEVVEALLQMLARKIQQTMDTTGSKSLRFALFIFEEVPELEVNVFYCASAPTAELLPLMEAWARRQVQ